MDMSVVAVDPPPSLPWIGVFLAVWPIFAVYFGRRGADIRLLMLLPISLSAAATGLALERVAQVLSLAGSGPHAVAAGLAEGVVPIAAGSVSALLTLAVVAYLKRASVFVTLRAPVLPLLGLTLFAEAALGVYLCGPSREYSTWAFRGSVLVCFVALATCITIAVLIGAVNRSPRQSRIWPSCIVFAAGSMMLTVAAIVIVRQLASFARGS